MLKKSMPINLITADELAEKLEKFHCPLSGDDVKALAHEDRIPYFAWVVPGNGTGQAEVHEPLFQLTATKEWLMENGWLSFKEGDPPATPKDEVSLRQRVAYLEELVGAEMEEK